MHAALAFCALIVEGIWGYPQRLVRAVGHPVSWIGALIAWCETRWNVADSSFACRRIVGGLVLLACLAVVFAISTGVVLIASHFLPASLAFAVVAVAASTLIAQRSLHVHVAEVAAALEDGTIDDARRAVSRIVGRETGALDAHSLARAAIESLSENFSDGIVAPVVWLVVGGLPGIALYKTVNTADSMIGHKNDRYHAFGWSAARLDDLVNLPASRLSALMLAGAAAFDSDANAGDSLRAAMRDARHHRSPNAGWPEAAMAGALGLKLAGPRMYDGHVVADHWMGDGRSEAGATDLRRALRLYRTACALQAGVVALVAAAGALLAF